MGLAIKTAQFSESDYAQFSERLQQNLVVLKRVLQDPDFGGDARSYGAELELYIVGADGSVLPVNQKIEQAHSDPLLTLELNRFNLEYNLQPVFDTDSPFSQLHQQLDKALGSLDSTAAKFGARLVPVGILPTLTPPDLGPECMTELPRYHALSAGLKRLGSGRFKIHIDGSPPLLMERDDVTMEGANTSFQFHYRVKNKDFAHTFNAFLLATPVIMGLAANSPTLFGHRLWHETRVPLFKHSIDSRVSDKQWSQPARVSLGQGWVRESAYELFAQTAAIHPPLLPVYTDTNYEGQLSRGEVPTLDELRIHQNSVWPWLRPVYDPADGGHLRIELRGLPAGPTNVDMFANAAFYVGLAEGLREYLDALLPAMPFGYAKYNFYRSAQFGLNARLVWPNRNRHQLQEVTLSSLIEQLLPVARDGLQRIGIADREASYYLDIIASRLDAQRTGASWQLDCLDRLTADGMSSMDSCRVMLQRYMALGAADLPVAQWSDV
jgi:gamma-glutamylcysteine synthetase